MLNSSGRYLREQEIRFANPGVNVVENAIAKRPRRNWVARPPASDEWSP